VHVTVAVVAVVVWVMVVLLLALVVVSVSLFVQKLQLRSQCPASWHVGQKMVSQVTVGQVA
jgi:hypothetical protein